MPYKKRKQKCKQSDGTPGKYVLSYTTKKGEKRRACHTSQKKMQGQIAAIEAESDEKPSDLFTETSTALRQAIRDILEEEIVSVSRRGESLVYDVEFDDSGDISSGEQVDVAKFPELEPALKIAPKYTTLPAGSLIAWLIEAQESGVDVLQDPFPGPSAAAEILNSSWTDTILWPQKSRVGKGETSMHLAFATDPSAREPDFVSADGSGRLSIKYFGPRGRSTAKTGEANTQVPVLTKRLASVLGIDGFPQGTFKESDLVAILQEIEGNERGSSAPVVAEVESIISQIKSNILSEHEADGIMAVTDAGFEFVPNNAVDSITVVYIRNSGTRIEFGGPGRSENSSSIEKGLRDFKQKIRESYTSRLKKDMLSELFQSHTNEPVVGDFVENVNPGCNHFGSKGFVINIDSLPEDAGTVASYLCTNSGNAWASGDVLTKSLDQLNVCPQESV